MPFPTSSLPATDGNGLGGYTTLFERIALALAAGAAALLLSANRRLQAMPWASFVRWITCLFVASRLAVYGLLYGAAHLKPRGDLPAYYFLQAEGVMRGEVPYRNFPSSYAPLHPYFDALILRVWHSTLALVLFSLLAECLLFWMWMRFSPRLFSETQSRRAALLYLASPISLQLVAVDGQDTVFVSLAVLAALILLMNRRFILSGLVFSLSVVIFKFLPLLFVPLLLLILLTSTAPAVETWRVRLRAALAWLLGFIVPMAVVYGVALWMRLPILQPLTIEGSIRTPGNLPFLLELFNGRQQPGALWDAFTLIAQFGIYALAAWAMHGAPQRIKARVFTIALTASTFSLVLLAKKSGPQYLMLILFPLCLLVQSKEDGTDDLRARPVLILAAFSLIAMAAPSFWFAALFAAPSDVIFTQLTHHDLPAMLFVVIQLFLLAGYGFYAWKSVRTLAAMRHADGSDGIQNAI